MHRPWTSVSPHPEWAEQRAKSGCKANVELRGHPALQVTPATTARPGAESDWEEGGDRTGASLTRGAGDN